MHKKITYFFILFFLCTATFANAQSDSYLEETQAERPFERDNWKRATEGIDYSEDLKKEREKQEETEEEVQLEEDSDSSFLEEGINSTFATILLIVLGVVLLYFILRAALGENAFARNKKIKNTGTTLSLEEIEENLEENDPSSLIEQAIRTGNYRLALRLYYLKVIRELSLAHAIDWKRDKTNGDYLRELRLADLRVPFRSITLAFERIWYGNRNLTEQEFQRIQPQFDHLINKIPKNEQ
ncbi:MAG: DUF4129 domain-containing protein [Bacteroidota bacterium]